VKGNQGGRFKDIGGSVFFEHPADSIIDKTAESVQICRVILML